MGAGNSTAASCSSLDLANGQTSANKYRYYQRQQNRQHYLHEHKLQRYRKHSEAGQLPSYLRQASSHLDLTTSHLVRDDEDEALFASKSNHNNQNNNNTNNELHYGFSRPAGEAYNLTNADVSCPVMVLPAKARHQHDPSSPPVLHLAASGGAKKSNAGVASRILQHRQQQRSNELKKFSDSLPSLNNMSITCQQQQSRMADMKQPIGSNHLHHHHPNHHHRHHPSQIMPTFHQHAVPQLPHQHYQHHHNHQNHNHNHNNHQPRQLRDYQQHEQCRPSSQGKQQPAKLRSKDRTTGAIQAAAGQVKQQQLTTSKQKVSNAILVSPNKFMDNHPMCYNRHGQAQSSYMMNDDGNDDDDDDCDHEQTVMGQRQVFDWPSKKQQQKQRQMKRATSLSSLHNLNQSNQLHAQQDGGYGGGSGRAGRGLPFAGDGRLNCRADMIIPTPFSQSINLSNHSNAAAASNLKRCHPSDIRASPRPPSLGLRNSNELGAPVNKCRQSPLNHELRGAGGLQQAYKLPPQTPQNHRQPSSQSHQINQAIMLKKSHKYKQAANVTSGQMAAKNNRYKSKQQQQQLQQPPNGCPVLPQLPRSQSLHELIQLRATENGQRMRTTGTLRGPLNGCDQVGKVNLVAELLETRRQQRQNLDEDDKTTTAATTTATTTMLDEGQRKNSETLLSQSSSTDDGIHDVSISGDGQNSTNDSRGKQYSSSSVSSSSDNHRHHLHRSSISSQDCQDKRTATPTRQRIFKKQPATSSQANRFAAHKNSSLEKAKQDTSYEHQVEGRRSQQQQSHMSTLKRSTSYSALQDTRSRNKSSDSCDDRDGDESDDLNELARFLYQFKQRQVKTQAENLSRSREKLATQKDVVLVGINERKLSSHASGGTINHDDDNQLQQSPNSTTSTSSGFASSTCTSNHSTSFASAGSDASSSGNSGSGTKKGCMSFESSTASTTSSRELRHEDASNGRRRISSPKKYPAPPRPDQTQQRQAAETNININAKSCPLSGKLKLSSSLLSIVDEYQSTLETNNSNRLLAKNGLHATSSSNLTSVHLFGGGANLVCQQKPAPSSSGQQQQSRRVQVVGTKDNVGGGGGDQEQHDDYDELQREQFEQLRKYTKLRQMSQSELALNHLTSSTMLDIGGKEKSKHQQRNLLAQGKSSASSKNQSHSNLANENKSSSTNSGKPYTNRLFNLIRRISEKSEPAAAASHHRAAPGCDDVSATSLADGNSSSQTGGCGVGKLVVLGSHSEGCGGGGHVGGANSVGGQLFRAAPLPDESCDQRRQTDGGGLNAINQIGEMKAEHHSKAKKCGNQERRVQAPDRLANESKDESASNNNSSSNNSDSYSKLSLGGQVKGIGGCGRAGESLCDLNFDCDFELIKNCRSANELDQCQQQQHTRQAYCLAKTSCSRQDAHCTAGAGKPSSLFTNTSSSITSNNEFGERQVAGGGKKKGSAAAIEKRREKNETANKAIANPSRENSNNNNWRLAPAASLIGPVTSNSSKACSSIGDTCGRDLARLRQGGGLVSSNRQQDHAVDNYNNNNKAAGKPNGRPRDAASEEGLSGSCCGDGCARDKLTKACKHHQQQPSKSKWSASSWLLGVGSGEKKKGSASSGSKKEPKTSSANNNNNDSKRSYLARLIPNSGTPTSGSSGKSKQRDDDILGGELSSCDMISEADRLLVELDHSLDLVSDGKHLSGQRRWWQGDSNEMDNSYNDDDEEDDYDYDENDEHERKADKVRVGREENRTFSREGVCINRAQKGGGYQVAVDDDENDNDDADYASINRAMINETFDFDPEKLTGTNGLTIEPAGSPSDSFTFSAPSSPTLGEKFNSTNGISEPSVKGNDQARLCSHHLGHRPMANDNPPPNALCKQSNDCTVDDSTESKRKNSALPDLQPSCCNRSNHLVGPFKCDHQQQQGAKATQAFTNGVARKGDNCVGEMAPVDNHNGTVDNHQACVESYNSRSRHNLNGAPAPMDDELYHQDQAGVQLASRPEPLAEVSIQACRLHALNDNKIAGELNGVATNPPTATSATPKQIHPNSDKTKGAQLSSRHAGNIGAKRCAEHGHINVVDASSSNATFNVCHHHRQNAPLDGRSSSGKIVGRCCNDVAELRTTTTQANDFVPSDSCGRREQQHNHRHDTDQPSPMLCTQTKQGIADTTSGSGSKGSADYIKQLSTPELVAATATTTTTAALTSTPSGNSRDHNANRPLATTDANKKKEANCIIANEQPLAGCSLGCLDNNAGVKWNGKRAMAVRGEIKAELEEAETDDRSRRTGDHSVRSIHGQPICCPAAPSCCAQAAPLQAIGNNSQTSIGVTTPASNGGLKQQQAAKFGKIELDKTEKKNGAELEAGSQACNCKLATATTTTRANVNMAPAQKGHFPIGECACERGGSLDVIGTCLGANCSPPPVGERRNCNASCLARKECIRCDRQSEFPMEDDKLIIQKDFCHCCSTSATGLQAHDDDDGQLLRGDRGGGYLDESNNKPTAAKSAAVCSVSSTKCTTTTTSPATARNEPLETGRSPASGANGELNKEPPKVTYYHYSHKMGNFAPTTTTTNGCQSRPTQHHHSQPSTRQTDAPGLKRESHTANGGSKDANRQQPRDASCRPPPNRSHDQADCEACGLLQPEGNNNDTSKQNSSASYKSSPGCGMMTTTTTSTGHLSAAASHSSDRRYPPNEDVRNLSCSHGGAARATGMNYAPTEEDAPSIARNKKAPPPSPATKQMAASYGEHSERVPNSNATANCCGSSSSYELAKMADTSSVAVGVKRTSEFSSKPQPQTAAGRQCTQTNAECLDRLQAARKCDIVNNNRSTPTTTATTTTRHNGQMIRQSNNEPPTTASGGSQFLGQTGRCNLQAFTSSNQHHLDCSGSADKRAGGSVLFGKLRNSLLNQRPVCSGSSGSSSDAKHPLASCQENYYAGPGVQSAIQSILLPVGAGKHTSSHKLSATTNDFDENFILKRKTPNAGLKSRC